jgi:uncharacterized protein (TIGR00255 family)
MNDEKSAAIASMTGFARAEGSDEACTWVWEIKSVNGRGLDVRCRLPIGFDALEPGVRSAVSERLGRGSVSVNLRLNRNSASQAVNINRQLVDQLVGVAAEYGDRAGVEAARIDGLLAIRGVVEFAEEEDSDAQRAARELALRQTLDTALAGLADARRAEGARIEAVLAAQLDDIADLTASARGQAGAQPEAILARIREQVAALGNGDIDPERLAQEAALLALKADVREELDRLEAHVAAARELLADGTVIGRRLDFLAQEFNREANTLCSKSSDVELTALGLELKSTIDRLREQVQNIE